MLSPVPVSSASVVRTTINELPQELLLDIARHTYQDMSVASAAQAQSTLDRLVDLQSLNKRWEHAFDDPRSAAANAVSIHQSSTGKKLASALRELLDLDPKLQASSWDAVASRLTALNPKPSRNTVRQLLHLMPTQAPAGLRQHEWEQKRDAHLARFAVRVLPRSLDLVEEFLLTVIESRAPMDGLVAALQDVICSNPDNGGLAKLLDEHVDKLPPYCRAGFEAAHACMRHGRANTIGLRAILDTVNAAPPRLKCRLLAKLGDRIPGVAPPHGGIRPTGQDLVDSIQDLPRHHRLTALQSVTAYGWEPRRAAMLLECLPADPGKAAQHLQKYLGAFDVQRRLDAPHAFNVLVPTFKHIFDHLRENGVATATQALAMMAPRLQNSGELQKSLLAAFMAYKKMLPPADKALVALLATALLARDGETKVSAFRLELQWLQYLPPGAIAKVIAELCNPVHRIPSYVVMSCLDTLKATIDRLPPALLEPVRTRLGQLVGRFDRADNTTAVRQLALY